MTLHFFAIPVLRPQAAQDEFNQFCLAHRVVNIERELLHDGANAYWALRLRSGGVIHEPDSRPVRSRQSRFDKPQSAHGVSSRIVVARFLNAPWITDRFSCPLTPHE